MVLRGKIHKVYCKNFVTYNECEFLPSEYLNIIIGPNGTGKSTLISAIVLCLGGEPKLLARASSIKDYVKSGCENAKIKVELYKSNTENNGEEKNTVSFKRAFNLENKSKFFIDNSELNKNDYLKKIASFNIQVENLCQFLPQDRVQDFAKMNPQELLMNTMNSVCSEDIAEHFKKLKELQSKQNTTKESYQSLTQNLNVAKTCLDELTQKMERFKSCQSIKEKLTICKIKEYQLELNELEKNNQELLKDLDLAKSTWENYEKEYNQMMSKQLQIDHVTKKYENDLNEMHEKYQKAKLEHTSITLKVEQMERSIIEEKSQLERYKQERADNELELKKNLKLLELSIQELQNLSNANKLDEKALKAAEQNSERFKQEIRRLNQDHIQWGRKIDEFVPETQNLKRQLEGLENASKQKLELLKTNAPDVYNALKWLEENKDMFEAPVYKPIMLEISVRNSNHAKYIENTIGFRDLIAFCCESISDMSLLTNELCVKRKLSVNVAHAEQPSIETFKPKIPINELRQFGFEAYLIDLIDGPQAVLGYLCSLYNLHNIPIGNQTVSSLTDSIPSQIRRYYSGFQQYSVIVSKYRKQTTLTQNTITDKGLLCSKDEKIIRSLKNRYMELVRKTDEIRNKRSSIEAELRTKELSYKEQMRIINENNVKKAELKSKEEEIKRSRKRVETLHQTLKNIPSMVNEFKKNAAQTLKNILQVHKDKIDSLKLLQNRITDKEKAKIKIEIFKQENIELLDAIKQIQKDKNSAKVRMDHIKQRLQNGKMKYEQKFEELKKLSSIWNPNNNKSNQYEFYCSLPNNMDELADIVNDYSGRLDCMDNINHEIINEYNDKCKEIETLEKAIQSNINDNQNIDQQISDIFEKWFNAVEQMIKTIGKYFSHYMQSMGFVGDVQLTRKSQNDFDSYGIEILVQYRKNVQLQALNRYVQSGGERAVAIAVYTLSMQHITQVPFRCVDEINQGMDAKNERKIWDMLVNETTKIASSQYFFVTPKLLPNLKSHERMTVHIVYNGRMVQPLNAFH